MDEIAPFAQASAGADQPVMPDSQRAGVPGSRTGTVKRSTFLGGLAAGAAWLVNTPAALASAKPLSDAIASSGTFPVGVGHSADPYTATQRAVTATGQWPASRMGGKTVVIKPNLVVAWPATSGATTDPQVVRALVDLALAAGAASVLIVEAGPHGAPFAACGYSFFSSYDPRVQLVDLATLPSVGAAVPNGLIYQTLYLPQPVLDPNVVFISAAKLKCQVIAVVTLSMKNLFGLAEPSVYQVPGRLPRYDLHARGVDQAIVDLNLARPVDFAVVDGIWGMEGNGPASGQAVQMNLVLAGANAVAVDRVALEVMSFSQTAVPHLSYAAARGLGPWNTNGITVQGDAFTPYPFIPAQTPPITWRPVAVPASFSPGAGQQTTIYCTVVGTGTYWARVEIIRDSDLSPGITVVRTLRDWAQYTAGTGSVIWNGRDDGGAIVAPGRYLARLLTSYSQGGIVGYATAPLTVTG